MSSISMKLVNDFLSKVGPRDRIGPDTDRAWSGVESSDTAMVRND